MKYTIRELATILSGNPDLAANIQVEASLAPAQAQLAEHESERELQTRIVAECDRRALEDERWGRVYAIPNGQYRAGERMEPGLRRGYPDLGLDIATHEWHGLRIELKTERGRVRAEQNEWLNWLNEQGYCAVVCRSYEDAIETIERYLR